MKKMLKARSLSGFFQHLPLRHSDMDLSALAFCQSWNFSITTWRILSTTCCEDLASCCSSRKQLSGIWPLGWSKNKTPNLASRVQFLTEKWAKMGQNPVTSEIFHLARAQTQKERKKERGRERFFFCSRVASVFIIALQWKSRNHIIFHSTLSWSVSLGIHWVTCSAASGIIWKPLSADNVPGLTSAKATFSPNFIWRLSSPSIEMRPNSFKSKTDTG